MKYEPEESQDFSGSHCIARICPDTSLRGGTKSRRGNLIHKIIPIGM